MNRPRIFLSAVSHELRTARKEVAANLHTLGFDTVSQDDFSTGHGELRNWLREQIDSCAGLIQLVGSAYGAELPSIDPDYGRVSYTQFEFLYASRQGKKTWVIVIGEDYPRDNSIEKLDLPIETAHPDPAGYQAERQKLQQNYIGRLTQENHLRHLASNATELQNIVLRLRDELKELRQGEERRIRRLTVAIICILLGIVVLGGGGWWAYKNLYTVAEQSAVINTEKIRAHLLQTADETHRRELAEADDVKDWKERQMLREAADNAHNARLSRIEELAAAFAEIEGRGTATNVFQEMTRILTEQGVDEAIAYVETQRPLILKTVRPRTASARERNRADLEPLLLTAGMYETKGQFDEAYALYSEIIAIDPNWAKPRNDLAWFLIKRGTLIEPGPGSEMLKEAVEICRGTIVLHPKEKAPHDWASTQNNLGLALQQQGIRTGGEAGAELLSQAVAAYRAALTVRTREKMPQEWAVTQNNLGNVLSEQAIGRGSEACAELLAQAIAAYRAALTVRTRESLPQEWAATQNNLGAALKTQGIRKGGEAGAELLAQAVKAYRAALTVYSREKMPQDWAMAQNNLGNTISVQAMSMSGEAGAELLSQAVAAYRAALTVYTRENMPQHWAATQHNLGAALKTQGTRRGGEAGAALLAQAVTACRAALTVRTRESLPQGWAATQHNLGNVLLELGRVNKRVDLLIEAKAVIQSTHSFYMDAGYPQYNLYFFEKLSEIEQTIKELF
jgi:tetratricopeptide (TPR) repeat protein